MASRKFTPPDLREWYTEKIANNTQNLVSTNTRVGRGLLWLAAVIFIVVHGKSTCVLQNLGRLVRAGAAGIRVVTGDVHAPRSRRSRRVIWFREGSPKEGDRIVAWYKLEWELGLSSGVTENYSSRSP